MERAYSIDILCSCKSAWSANPMKQALPEYWFTLAFRQETLGHSLKASSSHSHFAISRLKYRKQPNCPAVSWSRDIHRCRKYPYFISGIFQVRVSPEVVFEVSLKCYIRGTDYFIIYGYLDRLVQKEPTPIVRFKSFRVFECAVSSEGRSLSYLKSIVLWPLENWERHTERESCYGSEKSVGFGALSTRISG